MQLELQRLPSGERGRMMMRIGYNTNGLAHHALEDAIALLAELGYESVAITLDHGALNPYAPNLEAQIAIIRELLSRYAMRNVIETGGRYLLDFRQKHEPTLVTASNAGRAGRVDFLKRAIDLAHRLGSDCVSCWSGSVHDHADREQVFARLIPSLLEVLDYADRQGVTVGFEPEPGMFIDSMSRFEQLLARLPSAASDRLMLTIDIGHLHCQGEVPIVDVLTQWQVRIANIHIEDMRRDVHEHLMFGEGEIDFPPIMATLQSIGYEGGVHVELSRHSHEGPEAARRAREFLNEYLRGCRSAGG